MRVGVLALLASALLVQPAAAEWFVAPFLGVKFAGSTNFVDLEQGAGNTKLMFGATAGAINDGLLGVEADFGYSPRFFESSSGIGSGLVARSHVLTLMGNVIVTAPRSLTGFSLRPFISGGGGLMHVGIDDVIDALSFDSNLFGINVAGGFTGEITNRTGLRVDIRYFKSVSRDEESATFGTTRLSFWRMSVGASLKY